MLVMTVVSTVDACHARNQRHSIRHITRAINQLISRLLTRYGFHAGALEHMNARSDASYRICGVKAHVHLYFRREARHVRYPDGISPQFS